MFYKKDLKAAGDAAAIAAFESLDDGAMNGKGVFAMVGVLTSLTPVAVRREWYRVRMHPKASVNCPKQLVVLAQ
jgi:hypothetical protein